MTEWDPVAIGGVGGSGTRVVAAILREAGVHIGGDLNESVDNLWFTLLFKYRGVLDLPEPRFRQLLDVFVAAMSADGPPPPADLRLIDELAEDRFLHDAAWLRARASSLRAALAGPRPRGPWGWKEPNTHMVIDRLTAAMPRLKYIHVARNGLDMAFSDNKNQLRLWGPAVLDGDHAPTPRNALHFWCWAHARIARLGERMKDRFLFIRLEDLCSSPEAGVAKILSFAGTASDAETVDRVARLVVPPPSIGRHRGSEDAFDPTDIAFVRDLGFHIG